jgi:hypothetical protein
MTIETLKKKKKNKNKTKQNAFYRKFSPLKETLAFTCKMGVRYIPLAIIPPME